MERYEGQDAPPPAHAQRPHVYMVWLVAGFCTVAAAAHAAGSWSRTTAETQVPKLSAVWFQSQAFPVPRALGATDPLHRVAVRSRAGLQRAGAWVAELPGVAAPAPALHGAGLELLSSARTAARAIPAGAPRGPPAARVSIGLVLVSHVAS